MLPCILRKHLRTVSHKASLAPARRRGDGHRRFPAAKGGLGREGGDSSFCRVLSTEAAGGGS